MPSQYESIIARLDSIEFKLVNLETLVRKVIHDLGPRLDQQSFESGLLDLDEEVGETPTPGMDSEDVFESPRRLLTYKNLDGFEETVSYNDLDPKVQQIVDIARSIGQFYQLYSGPDGVIRVLTSNEVLAHWNADHPGPEGGR